MPKDAIVEGTIKEIEIVASAIKNLYKNLGFEEQGEKVNGVYQLMVWRPK